MATGMTKTDRQSKSVKFRAVVLNFSLLLLSILVSKGQANWLSGLFKMIHVLYESPIKSAKKPFSYVSW